MVSNMVKDYAKKEYDYVSKDYNKEVMPEFIASRNDKKKCTICKIEMECNLINFRKCSVLVKGNVRKIYLRSECRDCWNVKNNKNKKSKKKNTPQRAALRKYYHKNKNTKEAIWKKKKNVIHRKLKAMFSRRNIMNPASYLK